eukprot:2805483-Rhodomonas_salina.1
MEPRLPQTTGLDKHLLLRNESVVWLGPQISPAKVPAWPEACSELESRLAQASSSILADCCHRGAASSKHQTSPNLASTPISPRRTLSCSATACVEAVAASVCFQWVFRARRYHIRAPSSSMPTPASAVAMTSSSETRAALAA